MRVGGERGRVREGRWGSMGGRRYGFSVFIYLFGWKIISFILLLSLEMASLQSFEEYLSAIQRTLNLKTEGGST
jgi:hypothetical protein